MADLIRNINDLPIRDRVEISPVGLRVTGDIPYDEWLNLLSGLQRLGAAWKWAVGDGLSYGERMWGEKYAQAVAIAEEIGVSPDTIRKAQYVADRVEFVRRRTNLSWSHHDVVASLEPAEQEHLLAEAVNQGLSVTELREVKRKYKALQSGQPLDKPGDSEPESPEAAPDVKDKYPDDPPEDDLLAIVEEQQTQIRNLNERVEVLAEDDDARKLDEYVRKVAHLKGRVETLTRQAKEARKSADYYSRTIGEVRKALGVERNRDIIPAIQELRDARR